MIFAQIRSKLALVLLVAVCLLAVPALSIPMDDNRDRPFHGSTFDMKNDLTNDTAAGNASACPMRGDGRNMSEGCAMSGTCKMNEMGPMGPQFGRDGEGCNRSANKCAFQGLGSNSRCGKASQYMPEISPVLLMDDMTVADLENMTLNEIRALAQEKTQELNNMTQSEVDQLVQTRLSKSDNMTLSMFEEDARNMRQMARILEWASSEHHFRA